MDLKGFPSLPVRSLGWTTSAAFMEIVENSASAQLMRADGNLAYAFNPVISLKGGLNLSKFTKTEPLTKLDPNVGAQVGLALFRSTTAPTPSKLITNFRASKSD